MLRPRVISPRIAAVVTALVTLCVIAAIRLADRRGGERWGQVRAAPKVRLTETARWVQREPAAGDADLYEVVLGRGRFASVTLDPRGIVLAVAFYEPSGARREFFSRASGMTPLSWVAESEGNYLVEVRVAPKSPAPGRYRIEWSENRPARLQDAERIEAEAAQTRAEALHHDWTPEPVAEARELYRKAVRLWRNLADAPRQAAALRQLADLERDLDRPSQAVELLREALSLSLESGDRPGLAHSLAGLCALSSHFGKREEALRQCTQGLEIARGADDPECLATALDRLGELHEEKPEQARAHYQSAEAEWRRAGRPRGLARNRLNLCYSLISTSEENAAAVCDEALALWRQLGDIRGEALTLTAIGHLNVRRGDWQGGIDCYEPARRLFERMGLETRQASLLNGLGFVYLESEQPLKALSYHGRALELFERANHRSGVGDTLLYLGRAHLEAGDVERSLEFQTRALAIFEEIGDRRMQAHPLNYLGELHQLRGDDAAALSHLRRALALMRESHDEYNQAGVLNKIARIHAKQGRFADARRFFEEALSLNRRTGDTHGEILTLANFARFKRDRGGLEGARADMEDALAKVERLRARIAGLDLRASYFSSIRDLYDFQIDLLMRLHRRGPDLGLDRQALELSERSRARTLTEALSEARDQLGGGVDPGLLRRQEQLQKEIDRLAPRDETDAGDQPDEVRKLLLEYEEVRAEIRRLSPLYDPLREPRAVGLEEIQQRMLGDDSLLLEYALGQERSYLWAVTPRGLSVHELPARDVIDRNAREVFEAITARQPRRGETMASYQDRIRVADGRFRRAMAVLSRLVLGPVSGKLAAAKRLLVVSEGALQFLPFAALPHPGDRVPREPASGDGEASLPLLETHEIVQLPSASTLAALRANRTGAKDYRGTVAVLADPIFEGDDPRLAQMSHDRFANKDLPVADAADPILDRALRDAGLGDSEGRSIPRLVFSGQEAQAILSLAPAGTTFAAIGFDATRSAATSPELGGYRIVHFATHGLLNTTHPGLSGLVFSLFDRNGKPQNGFLRLYEIYNLRLPVDLVVLSACNTAKGQEIRGEGLAGLARGFMYAGASRVMASLWRVDDEATGELMKRFYRLLFERRMAPAAALREAQRELRRQPRWSSPFFWAAFQMVGD